MVPFDLDKNTSAIQVVRLISPTPNTQNLTLVLKKE
jgi:hypothetical protein